MLCSPSTIFPPNTGNTCGPRTRSRAPLPPSGTAQSVRRAACRTRRRSRWCSSWSMPPRKAGAGLMATTSCPSSFKVSDSPTGSRSPPTQRPPNPKPPSPEPSGHLQNSAIAPVLAAQPEAAIAVRTDLCAIFVSLELSRSTWLITSLSPGGGEKMSKYSVSAGDVDGLFRRFGDLQERARVRTGRSFAVVTIQEAGLDGFWIHRVLEREGIESWVVDPASILTSRRRRRAKTDRIDGETLVRTLLAHKRGEPRVCAMVQAPTPEDEDRRRLCRERKVLTAERISHVNRIKGLLFAQGVRDYEPLRRDRRVRLEELRTGDGRCLPVHLKAQISRELDRLEVILVQLKAVDSERDALLAKGNEDQPPTPASLLVQLKGIGPEFAAVLWSEGLFRSFSNRRQVAAYAGLAPTSWQSGSIDHEQ